MMSSQQCYKIETNFQVQSVCSLEKSVKRMIFGKKKSLNGQSTMPNRQ